MFSAAVFLLLLLFAQPTWALAEDDPTFREYLAQAGEYTKENRPHEAGEALRTAADLAGTKYPFLHMRLAKHYFGQGLIPEAIARAEKAVALAPSVKWFRYDVARFYLAGKEYNKAETELCTLLKLDPGFTSGYSSLAELYWATRQYNMARLSMNRAKLLGYRGKNLEAPPTTLPAGPAEDLDHLASRNMIFRFIKVASAGQAETVRQEIDRGKLFEEFTPESMNATKGEAGCGIMQSSELPETVAGPLAGMRPYSSPVIIRTGRDYRIIQRILPFNPTAWRLLAKGGSPPEEAGVEEQKLRTAKQVEPAAEQLPGGKSHKKETTVMGERQPPAAITALHTLESWKNAWEAADIDGYLAAYSKSFAPPDGTTFSAWKEKRQKSLTRPKAIRIRLSDTVIETLPNSQVLITFKQHYESDNYQDTVIKSVTMVRETDGWKILGEWIVRELPR